MLGGASHLLSALHTRELVGAICSSRPCRPGWHGTGPSLTARPLHSRSFDIDLRCPRCDGPMKLKSFLTSPKNLRRLLRWDEEAVPPPRSTLVASATENAL